uniref:Uncharacterized protein n=1 Tax=Arundo donax TaxID=35708 RepID=A0A0A9C694_ARUDO
MDEYTEKFLALPARVGKLDRLQQVNIYIAGLTEPLKTLALRLKLPVHRIQIPITVGTGNRIVSRGLCRNLPLTIEREVFAFDSYTARLTEPLKTNVELQEPKDLEAAMSLARPYEWRATVVAEVVQQAAIPCRLPVSLQHDLHLRQPRPGE